MKAEGVFLRSKSESIVVAVTVAAAGTVMARKITQEKHATERKAESMRRHKYPII